MSSKTIDENNNNSRNSHIPETHLIYRSSFGASIPNSVTNLVFDYHFNEALTSGLIPNSVIVLVFGFLFDKALQIGDIPNSVRQLTFGNHFNQPLQSGVIPDSVVDLTFGECFNQPLQPQYIPESVINLTFGYCFNQRLQYQHIPDSVINLTFGRKFNQPLKSELKLNVMNLYLPDTYNYAYFPVSCNSNVYIHVDLTNMHNRAYGYIKFQVLKNMYDIVCPIFVSHPFYMNNKYLKLQNKTINKSSNSGTTT